MKTEILRTATVAERETAVAAAVERLTAGDVVALPTETVYGLAADAMNVPAVLKVFEAKDRPRFDPLIVHLPDAESVFSLTSAGTAATKITKELTEAFWPGPFTLVLPHNLEINEIVCAGLQTVAVRFSGHPIFAEIVRRLGRPIAAPSANRFGRVSPTSAGHVAAELNGRIPLIIDAGPTTHGLESTIVAIRDGEIEILRHGPITEEQLAEFAPVRCAAEFDLPRAPGQLRSHYAPFTPLTLCDDLATFELAAGQRVGALAWENVDAERFAAVRILSRSGDLREAAANLFRLLRELDAANLDLIVSEAVPEHGLGHAIMDRLRRAAAKR